MLSRPGWNAHRVALVAVFVANGMGLASWMPRIAEVKAAIDLSDGQLGLALLGTAVGSIIGAMTAGRWAAHRGSVLPTVLGGLGMAVALPLPGLATSGLALGFALALIGFADGTHDVAMNVNSLGVQRALGRSILHGLHAAWSFGAMLGAGLGAVAAGARVPVAVHLALAGMAIAVTMLLARRFLRGDVGTTATVRDPGASPLLRRLHWRMLIGPTGLLALAAAGAAIVEAAPAEWGSVYLSQSLGAGPGTSGAVVAVYLGGILVGRLMGDRLSDRFGPGAIVSGGAWIGAGGLVAGMLAGHPLSAMAGVAVLGLGVSVVFPTLFAAADQLPGRGAAAGVAVVGAVGRTGGLVGPVLIGGLAEMAGLPLALGGVVAGTALISGLLARRAAPVSMVAPPR